MANCIIFCAAGFTGLLEPPASGDFLIAADGGLKHTQALRLSPHAIVGDFDSLGYVPEGAEVYPVEKDDTDAMLAIRMGLERGFRTFYLYGGLDGDRLDHTVANFQALRFLTAHGARGFLVGNHQIVTLIENEALRFPAGLQGDLSVFAYGGMARGVTLKGLYYPLDCQDLTPDFPLGVSNHLTGEKALVRVEEGALLVLWSRQSPLPEVTP